MNDDSADGGDEKESGGPTLLGMLTINWNEVSHLRSRLAGRFELSAART